MLNFFWVLGQIPGTDIQLTFTDIMCGILLILLGYLARLHRKELRVAYFHTRLAILLVRDHIAHQPHYRHLFKLPGRLIGRTS